MASGTRLLDGKQKGQGFQEDKIPSDVAKSAKFKIKSMPGCCREDLGPLIHIQWWRSVIASVVACMCETHTFTDNSISDHNTD